MKSHKTIYVNPVARASVQGRDKQMYSFSLSNGEVVSTVPMKKTKEVGVGSEYSFLVDFNKNRLDTGLDELMVNPFNELEVSGLRELYSLSAYWDNERLEQIISEKNIKKQTYFELLDDVKEGFYTSEVKGNLFVNRNLKDLPEPTYLEKFKIILYDRPNKFSTETPRGRIAIQLVNKLSKVAKKKEIVNSVFHDYYISEENEAELEKLKKQDTVNKAIYHVYKLKEEYSDYQRKLIACLLKYKNGKVLVKGEVDSTTISNKLNDYVSNNTSTQLWNVDNFLQVVSQLETPEGIENLHIKYLIQQAVNTNAISIRDGYYVWHTKAGTPNVYKFSDYNKLFTLIKKEFAVYIPKDDITNWYGDLLKEVQSKGITIENL